MGKIIKKNTDHCRIYLDFRVYAWWKKYLSACERVEGYLDRDFIGRVRSNVNRVK